MTGTETVAKPPPEILTQAEYDTRFRELWRNCELCNYDTHRCHFCGENLLHGSWEVRRTYNYYKREWFILITPHWLSDCRPDLMDGTHDGSEMTDGPLG